MRARGQINAEGVSVAELTPKALANVSERLRRNANAFGVLSGA